MRLPHLITLGTAAAGLSLATPAGAQEIVYDTSEVAATAGADEVIYHSAPGADAGATAVPQYAYPAPADTYPAEPHRAHATHYAAPTFDRDQWLAECRDRTRGTDRRKRGGIIGGLLGAIAGGVAGNRAWDSERLAGTLIGAGVGGIAGAAIGAAISNSGRREDAYDCEAYLDNYLAGYRPGHGYPAHYGPAPSYGGHYGYPYGYAMVPVTYAVPQRTVVREYVTEQWVDEPAPPVRQRVIEAPRPVEGKLRSIK